MSQKMKKNNNKESFIMIAAVRMLLFGSMYEYVVHQVMYCWYAEVMFIDVLLLFFLMPNIPIHSAFAIKYAMHFVVFVYVCML